MSSPAKNITAVVKDFAGAIQFGIDSGRLIKKLEKLRLSHRNRVSKEKVQDAPKKKG